MREYKIVVLGSMGAGKSTLVRAIAGGAVIDTDVLNTDGNSAKLSTTVAMDYADVDLPNGDRMRLYGTPGQRRFEFIWSILLEGASGVLLLVDATSESLADDLLCYLDTIEKNAANVPAVIGVTKFDLASEAQVEACSRILETRERPLPLLPFDARSEDDGMMLMDVLMSEIETAALI
jgi:small GTP-binding protein